jgi:succinate dehydrogenase / fumarate reductase cytochrome b subunit
MSSFFTSSIGKKFLMSVSGLFLVVFLAVHLTANLFILGGPDAFNQSAHFMGTNPIITLMQPILAFGFLLHIIYSLIIQIKNWKSRPVKYKKVDQSETSTWASRNMIWLGIFVFGFLTVHIINFFYVIKFGEMNMITVNGVEMEDSYKLVAGLFTDFGAISYIYSAVYIISFIALGLHLHHAFWSAFQTLGLSNIAWRKRLSVLGDIYAIIVAAGFTIIPLYFLLF